MASTMVPQGVRCHVARRRGRGCHGGGHGHVGEAREGLWPWLRRAVATVALGWLRAGETEEGRGGVGDPYGSRGSRGISRASRGKRQEAGGGRGTWARTVATRLSSYWREVGDDWQRRWAGPARWTSQLGCDR